MKTKNLEDKVATIGLLILIVAITILTIVFLVKRGQTLKLKQSENFYKMAEMEAGSGNYEAALEYMQQANDNDPEVVSAIESLSSVTDGIKTMRSAKECINAMYPETMGLGISGIYLGGSEGYALAADEVVFTFYGLDSVCYLITYSDIFALRSSAAKNFGFEDITYNNDYTIKCAGEDSFIESTGGAYGKMNIMRISLSEYNPFTADFSDEQVAKARKEKIQTLITHIAKVDMVVPADVISEVMK